MSGQGRGRGHVNRVDVRSFLAVNLDGHEAGVQGGCDFLILERLVGHHVAPVTGCIPDGQEDGFAEAFGLGKSLGSPLPPVDRIVLVLQQIRARGVLKSVRHHGRLS